jgi:hypothetical protein
MCSLPGILEQLFRGTSSKHQRARVHKPLHFAFFKFNVKRVTDDVLRTDNTTFLMYEQLLRKYGATGSSQNFPFGLALMATTTATEWQMQEVTYRNCAL